MWHEDVLTGELGGPRGEIEFHEAAVRGTITTASVGEPREEVWITETKELEEEPGSQKSGLWGLGFVVQGLGAGRGAGPSALPVLENTLGSASAAGTKCPWPLGAARVFQERKANRKE